MATVNKSTRTEQTSFKKIPKTNLFTDYSVPTTKIEHTHTYNTEKSKSVAPPQPQPAQIIQQPAPQPIVEKVIEKESSSNDLMPILLMSLLSNNSNNDVGAYAAPIPYPVYQPAPQYQPPPQIQQVPAPQPIQVQSDDCKNCASLPYDIPYIKEKLEELKKMISEFKPVVHVDKEGNIAYDGSELRKLVEKRFDENWDKLLEIEARLIKLQNEHYDINNLLDSQEQVVEEVVQQDDGQDDEYEEIIETTTTNDPGYVDNNEYYEKTITTTDNQGYVNNQQGYVEQTYQEPTPQQPVVNQNIEVKDYHMNKDNYKRFMNTLRSDVKK